MYRPSPERSSHSSPDYEEKLESKDSAKRYETERIQVLQQERVGVQKKTFTKWCNSYLEKVHMIVNDLFVDLGDGKLLMKLLEIISGENLGRPNRGVLRVQKMENVSRCLTFLATKVRVICIIAHWQQDFCMVGSGVDFVSVLMDHFFPQHLVDVILTRTQIMVADDRDIHASDSHHPLYWMLQNILERLDADETTRDHL